MRYLRLGQLTPSQQAAMQFHEQQLAQAQRAESFADQYRRVTGLQETFHRQLESGVAERNLDPATGRQLPWMQQQLIGGVPNDRLVIGAAVIGGVVLLALAARRRRRRRGRG